MLWNRPKSLKAAEKQVVIILDYESSGSTFLAQVVSYVLGKCPAFGAWRGRELNGTVGDPLLGELGGGIT